MPDYTNILYAFETHDIDGVRAYFEEGGNRRWKRFIKSDPAIINKKYSHFNNAFTPLKEATLLHHCAEFNLVKSAEALVRHGADVNAQAGVDESGFGGHTPLFHTVCQLGHASRDMLYYLLDNDAALLITVRGFVWGKGYEWETFIPSVNPVSYAMMGLLPQVHRAPGIVAEVVSLLVKRACGIDYTPPNVPNAYLNH